MTKKITGLGRGLDALIDTNTINTGGSSSISEVDIELITANPNQPRQQFDEATLRELADSIREHGVISPITLRKNDDGTYQIIAGERRFRASKLAGLTAIPAYIKTAADENVLEMALIENIQREDLNAIEIALTYYRLKEEYQLTQERLSERVGKSRESIANYLRLLSLPAEIQIGIKNGKIGMGHARAIIGIDNAEAQLQLYEAILKYGYSVRKIEEMTRNFKANGSFGDVKHVTAKPDIVNNLKEHSELKTRLDEIFGSDIEFSCNKKGRGKISIPFKNDEELMQIMDLLDKI
ncbi:MAG: ParB/RepB/Spo0J family partition protein [Paludibacter sp.]|jgi:ParB family chromosome partitioning protein|nr:ParB/RepB/Spo0J family partition protein [Paludibacter sp.]